MSKLQNNPIKDLKGEMLKTKSNPFEFDLSKVLETDPPKEEKQEVEKITVEPKKTIKIEEEIKETKTKKRDTKQAKTYRLPSQLINDIEKVLYMDRELRGNETTLITKAIESYIYSKENNKLIEEYNQLKGNN